MLSSVISRTLRPMETCCSPAHSRVAIFMRSTSTYLDNEKRDTLTVHVFPQCYVVKDPIVFNHRMSFVKAPPRLIHSRDHPTAYRLYARIVTDPEISVLMAFGRFRFQPSNPTLRRLMCSA